MYVLIAALFGMVVGSFLNVVILRFGKKHIGGRSACPACGMQLQVQDLVPILSWLFLRGRCRHCHARISIQYPLVEVITAVLFALVAGVGLSSLSTLIALFIIALLVCIFVYDLYHTIIPDEWVWPFVVAGAAFTISLAAPISLSDIGVLALAGPLTALPLFALWFVSRGRWMGFGDVKLALGIGWLLGIPFGISAVFLAFVIGALVSVCILLPLPHLRRFLISLGISRLDDGVAGFTMKSEVPFGPFLIVACLAVWFALLYGIPVPAFLYGY